ncbi:MAG: hypothetical protein N2512_00410, partial [Armatimonadetes bacterium]|nr:hypothetical protein [Armatimonadota bacterium]
MVQDLLGYRCAGDLLVPGLVSRRIGGRRTPLWRRGLLVASGLTVCSLVSAQHPAPVIPQGVDLSKPLTLEDVVKIALANSPTIPIATEEVRRAVASA